MKTVFRSLLTIGTALLMTRSVIAADLEQKDPQAAATAVTRALKGTGEINAGKISVTTHAGTVVLSGTVATEAESSRALTVAEQAAAGVRVSSSIKVEPPAAGTAAPASVQLVREVEAALRADPRTANLGVTVSINEQKDIGLHGLVPSGQDRMNAQIVASRVKGVTRVDNRLATPGR
jgi:osmotically-inducible protein OsmY